MSVIDQSIINFAIYEDAVDLVGMADATLPDLASLTQTISGAGIAGNIEVALLGHFDTMTLTLKFRTTTEQSLKLTEPRLHNIDIRVAQQAEDTVAGTTIVQNVKHVMRVMPKKFAAGTIAPAALGDASGEYAVRYWAAYKDEKKIIEVDPFNFICVINGVDYLREVRKALGK